MLAEIKDVFVVGKLWRKGIEVGSKVKKLAEDDPRRIVHSFKVASAITLVSLFYYFQPHYDGFGVNAMWAVLTVVVVFEFSVGATLGKGINRIIGTSLAGALAVGLHHLAALTSKTAEPILIGFFVFIFSAMATFLRFFPPIKARYDYGFVVFILTFCLVSVSSYRDDEVIDTANQRLMTIIIGCLVSVISSICIFPVWIGQDLQNLIASNIENLGIFLQEFGGEYFKMVDAPNQCKEDWSFPQEYKTALTSKSNEESMANLARWEPMHGKFKFKHPWKQYLEIGRLTRQCAYQIEALNSYLTSDTQAPTEIRLKIKETCKNISSTSGKALKEISHVVKNMTNLSSSVYQHIGNSKEAAENLKLLLNMGLSDGEDDIFTIIPAIAVASKLIEVVKCVEEIAKAVEELASLANFKAVVDATVSPEQPHLLHRGTVQPIFSGKDNNFKAITVESSPSFEMEKSKVEKISGI